ncbi:hypothetical protein LCGC14_0801560 [marine sediment metagenome]|uniref:Uncharacterized protein n=1 Tax=marine sediment metagenome TaxID=412755 RepID=A0A0F9SWK6_9ZZZZ
MSENEKEIKKLDDKKDKIKELDTKLKILRTLPETPTEKDKLRTALKYEKEKEGFEVVI